MWKRFQPGEGLLRVCTTSPINRFAALVSSFPTIPHHSDPMNGGIMTLNKTFHISRPFQVFMMFSQTTLRPSHHGGSLRQYDALLRRNGLNNWVSWGQNIPGKEATDARQRDTQTMKIFAKDNGRVDGQWNTGTGDKTFISTFHINAANIRCNNVTLRWKTSSICSY